MPGKYPSVKFEKKLIERDREFGFLICWGVFFLCAGSEHRKIWELFLIP
jgi:hypothetical protein